MGAGITPTGRIDRAFVLRVFGVLDIETTKAREQLSVPGIPGRQDAVEHVDAARHTLNQVFGGSRSHQVSRRSRWQSTSRFLNDRIHLIDGFPDAETPYRIALEANGHRGIRALLTQVREDPALDDAELRLARIG